MHVCGGTEIDFFLVETFFFLKNVCSELSVINALLFFFPSSLFWNINQYELEQEIQSWRYKHTNEILCICLSSWRRPPLYTVIHGKLYVYIAASFLVCPGWFLCCCVTKTDVTPGGKLQYIDLLPFDPFLLLFPPIPFIPMPHPALITSCPHSVKHCKRSELCKGLFLNTYFVHNVKPESVYFGKKKKKVLCLKS